MRNFLVEVIGRRRPVEVILYDEMARDPAAVLRNLAAFVGEPAGDMEFLTSATATLAPTHSVGGNPMRMTSGAIEIKPDDEWVTELAPRKRIVTTAIALPLLRRYGLPVRNPVRPDEPVPGEPGPSGREPLPVLTTNAWLRFDAIQPRLGVSQPADGARDRRGRRRPRRMARAPLRLHGRRARRAVTRRRERAHHGRRAREGPRRLSEVNGEKFDIVCAFEVLEHISEDGDALEAVGRPREARRVGCC